MVRVHLSPPIFDLALLFAFACIEIQRCVRRLAKYKNNKAKKSEKKLRADFSIQETEYWNLNSSRIQKSHLENWTKYARQTRDRTLWHPSLKSSQCFLKRVIINKYNYQRVKKLKSFRGSHKKGQAIKGAGRMPWHWEPMKDVVNCDKPRGAVSRRYIRGFPNGATRPLIERSTYGESNSHR